MSPDSTEPAFAHGTSSSSGSREVHIESITAHPPSTGGCVAIVRSWALGPIGVGADTTALQRAFAAGCASTEPHAAPSQILPLEIVPWRIGPDQLQVSCHHLLPTGPLSLAPLNLLRVLPTVLSDQAARGVLADHRPAFGFLTLDQARRLVLLQPSESRLIDCPVVGVWLSGCAAPCDPAVYAAAARFHGHPGLRDRATMGPSKAFLVLLTATGPLAPPQLLEATFCPEARVLSAAATLPLDDAAHWVEAPDPLAQRRVGAAAAAAPTPAARPTFRPQPPPMNVLMGSNAAAAAQRFAAPSSPAPAPAPAPAPPPLLASSPVASAVAVPAADTPQAATQWSLPAGMDARVLLTLQQDQINELQEKIREMDARLTQMTQSIGQSNAAHVTSRASAAARLEHDMAEGVLEENEPSFGAKGSIPQAEPAPAAHDPASLASLPPPLPLPMAALDQSFMSTVSSIRTEASVREELMELTVDESMRAPSVSAAAPLPLGDSGSSGGMDTSSAAGTDLDESMAYAALDMSSTRFLLETHVMRRALELPPGASAASTRAELQLQPRAPAAPHVLDGLPRIRCDPLEDAAVKTRGGIGPAASEDEEEEEPDYEIISAKYLRDPEFVSRIVKGGDPDLVALVQRRRVAQ